MNMVVSVPKQGKVLLDKLELTKLQERVSCFNQTNSKEQLFNEIHSVFHYEVCKWLQEEGFETL